MNEKVPVEDIVRIFEYLHAAETSYKKCTPLERKTHIWQYVKRVDQWLLKQHPKERGDAWRKLNSEFYEILEKNKYNSQYPGNSSKYAKQKKQYGSSGSSCLGHNGIAWR